MMITNIEIGHVCQDKAGCLVIIIEDLREWPASNIQDLIDGLHKVPFTSIHCYADDRQLYLNTKTSTQFAESPISYAWTSYADKFFLELSSVHSHLSISSQ